MSFYFSNLAGLSGCTETYTTSVQPYEEDLDKSPGSSRGGNEFQRTKAKPGKLVVNDDGPVVGHGIREVVIGQIMRFITAAVGSHRKDLVRRMM